MEHAKKKKKGLIVVIIIVVVLIGIVVGVVACSKALTDSIAKMGEGMIEVVDVEKRDISNDISVSGQVESENMVKITSTLTAKVKSINVEVGSEVKKGDVLCMFDSSDIQQQYDTLLKSQQNAQGMSESNHKINERNLENAKTERESALAQAQRSIDEATKARDNAYAKEQDLVNKYNTTQVQKGNLINQMNASVDDPAAYASYSAQVDAKEAELQNIDAQLQALREQFSSYESAVQSAKDAYASTDRSTAAAIQSYQDVLDNEQYNDNSSTQTELDKLKDMLDQCTVRAPRSGIITSLNIAEGSIPTTDALMTLEDKDALKITVSIAESDILKIKEGLPAVVKTTATGDEEFNATVSRVVNIYKGQSNALTGESGGGYSAEISIDDAEHKLLIGMNAKVRIILSEKKDCLSVPYESIVEDEDGTYHVILAVKQEDGTSRAKLAKVEKGMEGSYYTEITSSEVKEGDKVVMNGGEYEDGAVLPIFDFNAAVNAQNGGGNNE